MYIRLLIAILLCLAVPMPAAQAAGPVYTQACGGSDFALALKSDGTVWSWGSNQQRQLGYDSGGSYVSFPTRIQSLHQITGIACGATSGYALQPGGTVWVWGRGAEGQLGLGDMKQGNEPTMLSLSGVTQVDAGIQFALFVRQDGTLWATGANQQGQLGDGTTIGKTSPVQVSGLAAVGAVAAGGAHSLAVTTSGQVYAWGSNSYGGIGNGGAGPPVTTPYGQSALVNIVSVSAGNDSSFALDSNGQIWCWGVNTYGQLGFGDTDRRYEPTLLTALSDVASIHAGGDYTHARLANGELWGWGSNWGGKLGDGTGTDRHAPVRVQLEDVQFVGSTKSDFVLAGTTSDLLYSWGNNSGSVLGYNGGSRSVPGLVIGLLAFSKGDTSFLPVVLPSSLNSSAALPIAVADLCGYNSGWTLSVSATPFYRSGLDPTTGDGILAVSFPASSLTVSGQLPITLLQGMEIDAVHGPRHLPGQTLGATAVPIMQADTGYGTGIYITNLSLVLAVPETVEVVQAADSSFYKQGDMIGLLAGTYTCTLTLTLTSGL
ncbi:hypothetical protein [Paenibacillus sp. BR1-192]|uniref:RCC1 domain-containing protein n=1 Tax=Paenibacillus sp. BR1-192 TaxID=3032287 RepID=UPI00240DEB92|nr:hypothetical protein [Paenibacillus sp. BR1-192]WFB59581.1 hypothetical protein P0X86_04870 [Paenibacillus sp. BR1-192]